MNKVQNVNHTVWDFKYHLVMDTEILVLFKEGRPPLGGTWFYNRFERFTDQASGFAGGR